MTIVVRKVGSRVVPRKPGYCSLRNEGLWLWGSDPSPKTIRQLTRHLEKCVDESLLVGETFTLEFRA